MVPVPQPVVPVVSSPVRLTGAQTLVRLLQAEGVEHVFGLVGGKLSPFFQALSSSPDLQFLGVRHEAAGPMMAAALAAATGRVAVAVAEMGPGGLNLASGLGVAYNNHLPLLALTSNQHRAAAYPHRGVFMDLDTCAVTAPVTKWNAVVTDPRRLPELVRRAFREACSGCPGPVHLDIPQDVLTTCVDWPEDPALLAPPRYRPLLPPRPAAQAVQHAVAVLRQARRPLLVGGGGVVASGAVMALRELAARLQAPVLPTQMALGLVASDSPHFMGHGGLLAGAAVHEAFGAADVILSVGCRWSSWLWDAQGALARPHHRVIQINLDPAALGHNVAHEVALQADAGEALRDILAELGSDLAVEADWLARVRAARQRDELALARLARETDVVMHPAALAQAVGLALPANALAVYDGGHTSFWSNDFTPVRAVRTRFHEPGMAHLGYGLPAALALQRQFPDRAVFNLTGDGAFGFTLNELDTARRYRLPVVTVVHNNAAWGVIRMGQRQAFGFEMATGLEGTDYAAIARGFGCYGERVERPVDVQPAIARALASGLPAVLDCQTRFEPHPAVGNFVSMNKYGFPASLSPQ